VIDFCLTKRLKIDPVTSYESLELCWASKVNCEQRAGRAGRVMDGRVYRLVPKAFYDVSNVASLYSLTYIFVHFLMFLYNLHYKNIL